MEGLRGTCWCDIITCQRCSHIHDGIHGNLCRRTSQAHWRFVSSRRNWNWRRNTACANGLGIEQRVQRTFSQQHQHMCENPRSTEATIRKGRGSSGIILLCIRHALSGIGDISQSVQSEDVGEANHLWCGCALSKSHNNIATN